MITQQHQDRLVAQGRDEMMTAFCKVARPNEAQQREASERFTALMQELVPQIVGVVAVGDYPSFGVKLENIDGKGKIALKAVNVDEAGPALITHIGASLTLVLTDAAQFDRKRPAPNIDPDQKALPMEQVDGGEDDSTDEEIEALSDEEPGEEEDDGIDLLNADADGPLFSVIDVGTKKLGDGSEATVHVLLHRDQEVFEPMAAPAFVQTCADALNDLVGKLGRDLSPFEVRDTVIASIPTDNSIGVALNAPYTTEAIQNSAAPAAEEKTRRGRLSDARKVEMYHVGYDAAEAGRSVSEAGEGFTDGETKHIQRGWADQKDGKARAWERPGGTPKPANDDSATGADSEAA
ncbi:hypothetical protein [Azospirillum brasilense]|uniref:hypothetical protein n=1 Tax=Azospirillum brasilense TaxID=192 RepID=UPI000E68F073|nr:hypothetical protein [Azospirillum brasilense]NUB28526.1 hypothetical protein [Azospirillum brasilense]NUB35693.1 hypothetical protein [Azospirillum brasilense]RIV96727.1 hypothetical protein D2T81_30730 [Azospirillum brasilense]